MSVRIEVKKKEYDVSTPYSSLFCSGDTAIIELRVDGRRA